MSERFLLDPATVSIFADDDWPEILELDGQPLHVEVGFGKDVRILRAAADAPDATFLGIEISSKKQASFCRKVARLHLRNVRAYCGDVRDVLMEKLPEGSVASFTILFPDPWPKRRHNKHRWIQPETARLLALAMAPGAFRRFLPQCPVYLYGERLVLAQSVQCTVSWARAGWSNLSEFRPRERSGKQSWGKSERGCREAQSGRFTGDAEV